VAVQLVFEMDRGEWEGREEFGCLVSGERERGGEFMRDKNEYGKLGLMVSLL